MAGQPNSFARTDAVSAMRKAARAAAGLESDGRVTKKRIREFDAEKRKKFLGLLTEGLPLSYAAALVLVADKTVIALVKRGRAEGKGDAHDFALSYDAAMASKKLTALRKISNADDWRSAAWLLGVLDPHRFNERVIGERIAAKRAEKRITPEMRELDARLKKAEVDKAEAAAEIAKRIAKKAEEEGIGAVIGLGGLLSDPRTPDVVKQGIRDWAVGANVKLIGSRDLGAEPDEAGLA